MDDAPSVDDPTDAGLALDDPLGALALALMSRLRATKAVGALVGPDGLRVAVVKGGVRVSPGDRLGGAPLPPELAVAGLVEPVPLRYAGEVVGLLALGPRLGGGAYTPSERALARSLASATAASLVARRTVLDLAGANRSLAARAQALRTLFELAQAFGRALDRDAIVGRLAFALMGQLVVRQLAVALCDADGRPLDAVLVRGGAPVPEVPQTLAALDAPAPVAPGPLADAGWRWAVPLRAGDVSRGAVLLGDLAAGPLDADGADFAAALAALAVGALETADRVGERIERERLREEVRLAREVQARLLPTVLPTVPGLEVAARWRPSRDVSGDTYDAVDLGGGRLLVAVADVVGKGIGASLLMATVQAGFRMVRPALAAAADPGPALAAATARIDRLVTESTDPHQFVTLTWAVIDAARGDVWAVVAGHPPPRVVRADRAVEPLVVGGPLLGVLTGPAFSVSTARLDPGDVLVLYTDGATEARDPSGAELTPAGLDRLLAGAPRQPAALADAVVEGVDAWAGGGGADDDDLTLVAVRRGPPRPEVNDAALGPSPERQTRPGRQHAPSSPLCSHALAYRHRDETKAAQDRRFRIT